MNALVKSFLDINNHIKENRIIQGLDFTPSTKSNMFYQSGKEARFRALFGGNRSGKTYDLAREFSYHVRGIYPPNWEGVRRENPAETWVVAADNKQMEDSVKPYFFGTVSGRSGFYPEGCITPLNKTKEIYLVEHKNGTSKITFKSAESANMSFTGGTIDIVWIDEECNYEIYQQCVQRTMDVSHNTDKPMLMLSMTPENGFTQLYNSFIENAPCGVINNHRVYFEKCWDEATHLKEEEKQIMRSQYTEDELHYREFGKAYVGSGLIYNIPRKQYVVKRFDIPDTWQKIGGLDFGLNGTAAIWIAKDPNSDKMYVYRDFFITDKSPAYIVNIWIKENLHNCSFYSDPSGRNRGNQTASWIDLFREAGLKRMVPADNAVESGIGKVKDLLESGRLSIFDDLDALLGEMSQYKMKDGAVVKKNDHLCDAMRYAVASGLNEFNTIPQRSRGSFYYGS